MTAIMDRYTQLIFLTFLITKRNSVGLAIGIQYIHPWLRCLSLFITYLQLFSHVQIIRTYI